MSDLFQAWSEQLEREILVHGELLACVSTLSPTLSDGDAVKITKQMNEQRRLTAKVQAIRHRRQRLRQQSRSEFGCDTIARLIPHAPIPMQPQLQERRDRLHDILTQLQRQQELAQQLMRTHLGFLNDILGVVAGQPKVGIYGRQGRETNGSNGGTLLNLRG